MTDEDLSRYAALRVRLIDRGLLSPSTWPIPVQFPHLVAGANVGTYLPIQTHRDRTPFHGLPNRNELAAPVPGKPGAASTPSSNEMRAGADVPPPSPADLLGACPHGPGPRPVA